MRGSRDLRSPSPIMASASLLYIFSRENHDIPFSNASLTMTGKKGMTLTRRSEGPETRQFLMPTMDHVTAL